MTAIPTSRTQQKLAELLHEEAKCGSPPYSLDDCTRKQEYITRAAFVLAKLLPAISGEMFPAIRDEMREKISYLITAELVCCDIHERLEAEAAKGHWDDDKNTYVMPDSWKKLKKSRDYHDICHYGGWAASLALNECPNGQRRCDPSYFCPTNGEWESPCHGGFDVCCNHPELHQQITPPASVDAGN